VQPIVPSSKVVVFRAISPLPFKPGTAPHDRHALIHHPLSNPEIFIHPDLDLFTIGDFVRIESGAIWLVSDAFFFSHPFQYFPDLWGSGRRLRCFREGGIRKASTSFHASEECGYEDCVEGVVCEPTKL
jgi:hypothetical protein